MLLVNQRIDEDWKRISTQAHSRYFQKMVGNITSQLLKWAFLFALKTICSFFCACQISAKSMIYAQFIYYFYRTLGDKIYICTQVDCAFSVQRILPFASKRRLGLLMTSLQKLLHHIPWSLCDLLFWLLELFWYSKNLTECVYTNVLPLLL